MYDAKIIYRCCGTCRRWEQNKKDFWKGTCRLDGKPRGIGEMSDCLGWKQAELEEIKSRGL